MTKSIELSRISATLVKISQGGQGVVYKAPQISIPFAKSMVYKEYKQAALAALDVNALKAMPACLESLPYGEGARLISIAAWPCRVVEDNGRATGFVMPTIPDEFFTDFWTVKGPSKIAAEFQHLLNEPHVLARSFGGQMISDRQRYGLLRSLVSALTFLHGHGICVGDLSPKNLLFSLSGNNPETYFIDCDAMRVNGVSLTTQLETPGWEVPTGEEKATTFSDRYKLGLLALRLIVGSQDAKDPARLPASVHPVLRQVITNTLTQPAANRPNLSTWDSALEQAWQAAPVNAPPPPPPPPTPRVIPVQVIPPPSPPSAIPMHGMPPPAPIPVVQPRNPPGMPTPQYYPQPPTPSPQYYPQPPTPSPQYSKSSGKLAWLLVPVVFGALVLAAKFDPAWFSDSAQAADKRTTASTTTRTTAPTWTSTSTVPPRTTTTSPTPVNVIPPPGASGPDPTGESCSGGYSLTDRSGWATKAIRGTARTSCKFTESVLIAYWNTFGEPSRERRDMEVAGSVRCDSVAGASCAPGGRLYEVTCQADAGEDWITCEGGVGAEVYLY
ncbi:hypothetical protein [Mycobacterium servetii]|uniref:Protein kinase domain-containing protein n=1 Tax=Mycobacterium servetii TaxID=3237418 RepID=A0ABV4C974_9MYCO